MSSFKPIDGSKEDFRKYLDRKGVLDAITKVLIKCNSDRPENAIEFLLENLGEKVKDKHTIACLETDLADARSEIEALKRKVESLQISAAASSQAEEGASDSVASEAATADKEAKVGTPVTAETGASQDASTDGDGKGEVSAAEPSQLVPKEQVASQ
uniref:C-myc-binding protein n=1 Tax=Culex tarsalis TaxID=7177 RepID=A0A1Q3EWM5_CULTA